jgi:hypothetical protein
MAFESTAWAGRPPTTHQDLPGGSARRHGEREHPIVVGMTSRNQSPGDDKPELDSRDSREFCEHRSPAFRVARPGGER